MDVGNPSNFIRIRELFHQQFNELTNKVSSVSISDEVTVQTIKDVYQQYYYILDPHGAVAFAALQEYLHHSSPVTGNKGFILETAHPVKFPETVEDAIGKSLDIPPQVQHLLFEQKESIRMKADFNNLKEWLMNR
jgi:threonine synthase